MYAFLESPDLNNWAVGQTKNVLVLDRNFEEYCIDSLDESKIYSPKHFFKPNKCKIKNNAV